MAHPHAYDRCIDSRLGTAVAQWLRCCATNLKVAGSIPDDVIGIFHWHKILPIALWSWGRLSLWQKWVPGAFPGGKSDRCLGLTTLPPSWAVVMQSGNLNFLEHSGPLRACNGTALSIVDYKSVWNTGKSYRVCYNTQGFSAKYSHM